VEIITQASTIMHHNGAAEQADEFGIGAKRVDLGKQYADHRVVQKLVIGDVAAIKNRLSGGIGPNVIAGFLL